MTREDLMNQFHNYPDVVEVTDLCAILGGVKAKDARQLLQAGKIKSFLIGRKYQIPKECVIDYLLEDHSNENHAESNAAMKGDLEKAKGSLSFPSEAAISTHSGRPNQYFSAKLHGNKYPRGCPPLVVCLYKLERNQNSLYPIFSISSRRINAPFTIQYEVLSSGATD